MKTNWKLKILSIFMTVSLVIGMLPITANAATVVHHRAGYKDLNGKLQPINGVEVRFTGWKKLYAKTGEPYKTKDGKEHREDGYGKGNYKLFKNGDIFEFTIPNEYVGKLTNPNLEINNGQGGVKATLSPNTDSTDKVVKFTVNLGKQKLKDGWGVFVNLTFDLKPLPAKYCLSTNEPDASGNIVENDKAWTQVLSDKTGSIKGLKSDVKWENGRITDVNVLSNLKYNDKSLSEIENEINATETAKNLLAEKHYKKFVIKRISDRLNSNDKSYNVDLVMAEKLCNVSYAIEEQYKDNIKLSDCFKEDAIKSLWVEKNTEITLPSVKAGFSGGTFTKDGKEYKYTFKGWKANASDGNVITDKQAITADGTFIACFDVTEVVKEVNKYTVKYAIESKYKDVIKFSDCFAGELQDRLENGDEVEEGKGISLPSAKDDFSNKSFTVGDKTCKYRFIGWKTDESQSEDDLISPNVEQKITANTTFIACFEEIKNDNVIPDEETPGAGPDNPGQDNPGQDNPGQDNPGQDNPGQDNPGQDNPGQDNPGQDNPGQDNPGQDNPGQENPGQDNPGQDNPGQDNPGQDNPGQENPGQDNPGQDNPGQDNPGQDNPGQDNPGQDNPGQDNPGQDNPEQDNPDTTPYYPFIPPIVPEAGISESNSASSDIINDESTPLSAAADIEDEDTILQDDEEIADNDTPLASIENKNIESEDIDDEDTPLADIPKTGEICYVKRDGEIFGFAAGFMAVLMVFVRFFKKKASK